MLQTNSDEIIRSFANAKNINAAVKNFLKREGRGGEVIQSFAKSFRTQVVGRRPEALESFVQSNYPRRELMFMGLARYAYPEAFEAIVANVIDKHAETFNSTYTNSGEEVQVTNPTQFKAIVDDVVAMIRAGLGEQGAEPTNFLVNSIMGSIFEPAVLREVSKVV